MLNIIWGIIEKMYYEKENVIRQASGIVPNDESVVLCQDLVQNKMRGSAS